MTTNAAKATSFYSSFTSSLASLEAAVSSAQSSKDFDAALAGIVDARSTLKEKDLEGLLTNRDKEQYEKVRKLRRRRPVVVPKLKCTRWPCLLSLSTENQGPPGLAEREALQFFLLHYLLLPTTSQICRAKAASQ
jgi:hypothetical protein